MWRPTARATSPTGGWWSAPLSVSRETFLPLLEALAAEPDPHTTVSEPEAALEVHVADSLSGLEVSGLSAARRIADIGAGAGFPGLVLAMALPRAQVDLVESAGRKTALMGRLIQAVGLSNARSVTARVEDFARIPASLGGGAGAYDAVTARAVGPLAVLVEYAAPLLLDGGVLVAWKGARDADEEAAGAAAAREVGMAVEEVLPVKPYPRSENRHLHVFRKVAPTPDRFPRRAGMARKRPLA
ncbi:MAG TPA: 16S rRNA (guanine(527)-N(7))-methyltransferase RsmG [Thermoleophilaceae bacterium]|nr:16S rRNA (guanine(527)-N(7))-methyltransferase RsmG [Thermoleophilaceae bacterium]